VMDVPRTLTVRKREQSVSEKTDAVVSSMSRPSSCSVEKNFSQISVGRIKSGSSARRGKA
jgi:hypothetical protein